MNVFGSSSSAGSANTGSPDRTLLVTGNRNMTVYLGKVYWAKDRLIDFCLQF